MARRSAKVFLPVIITGWASAQDGLGLLVVGLHAHHLADGTADGRVFAQLLPEVWAHLEQDLNGRGIV